MKKNIVTVSQLADLRRFGVDAEYPLPTGTIIALDIGNDPAETIERGSENYTDKD